MAVFPDTMNRGDARTIERGVHRISVATGYLLVFADGANNTWRLSEGEDCEPGDAPVVLLALDGTNFGIEFTEPTGTEPPSVDPVAPQEAPAVRGDSDDSAGTGSYESRTIKELRALAKSRGLEGYSKLDKDDLITELRDA